MQKNISQHFKRSEFACKCGCGQDTVDYGLVLALETLRNVFGSPVIIGSGNRCHSYNKKIGGAKNSQHLRGKAADFVVIGVSPAEIYHYLCCVFPHSYGIGKYRGFTHFDVRDNKSRWSGK